MRIAPRADGLRASFWLTLAVCRINRRNDRVPLSVCSSKPISSAITLRVSMVVVGSTVWPTRTVAPAAQPGVPAVAQLDVMATLDKALFGLPEGWAVVQSKALSEQLASAPPILIDLREKSEVEKGYIAGAVNIPLRTLADNLNALPADKAAPIVVYCGSGHRSAMVMEMLRMASYTNVKSLAGSTNNWTATGLTLTGGA